MRKYILVSVFLFMNLLVHSQHMITKVEYFNPNDSTTVIESHVPVSFTKNKIEIGNDIFKRKIPSFRTFKNDGTAYKLYTKKDSFTSLVKESSGYYVSVMDMKYNYIAYKTKRRKTVIRTTYFTLSFVVPLITLIKVLKSQ